MKTRLIEHSAAIADAIHYAYGGSSACHCHGDGKLSEAELMDALCRRGHVHHADAGRQALDIRLVLRDVRSLNLYQTMLPQGVEYLPQLQAWTFADLLRLQGVGVTGAAQIELTMSRYGLALKDGDPSRYRHLPDKAKREAPGGRPIEGTPDEIRATVAKELVKVGQRMLSLGGTIVAQAIRVAGRKKAAGALSKSLTAGDKIQQEARLLAHVIRRVEQRETALKKVPGIGRAAVIKTGNVVTGAFAAAAGD